MMLDIEKMLVGDNEWDVDIEEDIVVKSLNNDIVITISNKADIILLVNGNPIENIPNEITNRLLYIVSTELNKFKVKIDIIDKDKLEVMLDDITLHGLIYKTVELVTKLNMDKATIDDVYKVLSLLSWDIGKVSILPKVPIKEVTKEEYITFLIEDMVQSIMIVEMVYDYESTMLKYIEFLLSVLLEYKDMDVVKEVLNIEYKKIH